MPDHGADDEPTPHAPEAVDSSIDHCVYQANFHWVVHNSSVEEPASLGPKHITPVKHDYAAI